jgi:hypothetical protein
LTPIFPGTISTPRLVLGLVSLYAIPAVLTLPGFTRLLDARRGAAVLVALFFGPLALTWFMLTTGLTPEFFGAAQRVQVHTHIALIVVAAVGATSIREHREFVGKALLVTLVVGAVMTMPLAFVHLDTATAPRTVHHSEFAAVSFASTTGTYASDHRLARVGPLYFGDEVTGITGPTRQWLQGGSPPACPTVVTDEWIRGAHFYPLPPVELAKSRLTQWRMNSNLVYAGGGAANVYVGLNSDAQQACKATAVN